MQITLSTLTFDLAGVVTLEADPEKTNLGELRRRMNRVATLDGGAVINDSGYSQSDRTLALVWPPASAAQEAAVARLVQLYARLHVATPAGLFLAAVQVYTPGAVESNLTLLVIDKLA